MEAKKYLCNHCSELFDLLESPGVYETRCPKCSSEDFQELIVCSLEFGPPPWEYVYELPPIKIP